MVEEKVLTSVGFVSDISGDSVGEKNICHCATCQAKADADRVFDGELPRFIAHLRIQTRDVTADVTDIINLMDQVDPDRPSSDGSPPGKGPLKIVFGFV